MVYASAYTYRATVWFDCPLPSPDERAWLAKHYPSTWPAIDPVWERITARWREGGPGLEWYAHGTTPVGFCDLCQLVLCSGTPTRNAARTRDLDGRRYIFCSDPCERIFMTERERYAAHTGVVMRILGGEAPANLLELLRVYFGLTQDMWGKDTDRGHHAWRPR
jgi:toluene monooxygenase system protein A